MRRWTAIFLMANCVACENPQVGRVIWWVGDSTAAQTLEEMSFMSSARERGDVVVPVGAIPGARLALHLPDWIARLESAAIRMSAPDVVVIQLGTNDMSYAESFCLVDTPAEAAVVIDGLLSAVPPGIPVVWVVPGGQNIHPWRRAYFALQLAAAGERWSALSFVMTEDDWYQTADAHFSTLGEQWLAMRLVSHVDTLFDSQILPTAE